MDTGSGAGGRADPVQAVKGDIEDFSVRVTIVASRRSG